MNRVGRKQVRAIGRVILRVNWMALEIVRGAMGWKQGHYPALWLHRICRRMLRLLAVHTAIVGKVPTRGLLVANHLSYLDVILLSALTPCVFVAKSEVAGWPVFGWFARMAGTIFVHRGNRRDTVRAKERIQAALRNGALVVLFPEGTSSDGSRLLPFKSSLLEAAIGARVPVTVAALHFELTDGNAGVEVCYWGNHTLLPHLLRLMSKEGVNASVVFSAVGNTWRDRKKLAVQLRSEVAALCSGLRRSTPEPADSKRCESPGEPNGGVRIRAAANTLRMEATV